MAGLTPDVTAAENYTSIVAIAPSTLEQGVLWVGTDDGRVHVTRNGGEQWTRVDERAGGVPDNSWVPMITPSPHEAGTAFVVFDNHRRSDMKPYVYRVTDYGRRWQSLATDEISGYALSVLQDPVDPDLLFVGTEFGLFVSTDGGEEWLKFTAGVPTTSVMDMAIQQRENDLVLGTHGRSAYVIDDYSALRGLDESDFDQRLEILSVTPGQQYVPNQTPSTRFPGSGEFRAENEPFGVLVTFMAGGDDLPLPDKSGTGDKPKVEVTVQDASGETIRRYRTPVRRGVNRLVWGTERDGVRPTPSSEPFDDSDGLPGGPAVPAGTYRLTLSLESEDGPAASSSRDVVVLHPPRSEFTERERQINFEAQLQLQGLQLRAVEALERLVAARNDINSALALLARNPDADSDELKALRERAETTRDGLDAIEERFRQREGQQGRPYLADRVLYRIGMASGQVASTLAPPNENGPRIHRIGRTGA